MQQPAFCSLSDLLDRCDVFSEPLLGNLCSRSVCRHLFQCCLNFITQPGITFFEANAIFFCCDHIIQAQQRKQHFGLIENAFIRLVDGKNDQEILKYNLTEDYSGMTAMIFGEIYRYNGEWKFGAIGQGTRDGGIGEMAARFQK